jgi:DNA (cytosine-5)-methyltransferase 1
VKYLSVCSGIEAATVAWHPLGWKPVAFSEIERFPSEVLAHHYPQTPNLGDMTKFKEWNFGSNIDVFVGGTPCQSFSVAGLRKGLDDPRGNLMLTYLAIADKFRPRWLVWENVPGVLSSNGGKDFGTFLGGLGELGYGFAYRVLDAQYFGVAQRRRRVFVVGYLGDWRPAAAVLFERHSLSGNIAPSREKGKKTTSPTGASLDVSCIGTLTAGFGKMGAPEVDAYTCLPTFVSYGIPGNWIGRKPENGGNATEPMYDIAPCLTKADQHGVAQPIPLDMMNIRGRPSDDGRANRIGRGYGEVGDPMFTITKANHHAVAQPIGFTRCDYGGDAVLNGTPTMRCGSNYSAHLAAAIPNMVACLGGQHPNAGIGIDQSPTLTEAMGAGGGHIPITFGFDAYNQTIQGQVNQPLRVSSAPGQVDAVGGIVQGMAVRRLTPVECERLQGFPDNYTDIKTKGKPTPDGPRYKSLGNSMAVPVMRWIGERINAYEQ